MHLYSPPAAMPSDSARGRPIPRGVIASACVSQPAELAWPPWLDKSAELLKGGVGFLPEQAGTPHPGIDEANVVKRGTFKEFYLAV